MDEQSEEIGTLADAIVACQGDLQNVTSDAENPHFRNRYASLPHILDTVRPVLRKHGLAVIQLPTNEDARVGVRTILMHKSGQFLSSSYTVPTTRADPQQAGSAITYCRRYSLAAVLGIGQEDDDAEGASRSESRSAARSSRPAPKQDAAAPPERWLDQTIGFGKHRDKTWRWLSQGSVGGEREGYLLFLVDRVDKEPIREKARACLKLMAQAEAKKEPEPAVAPSDAQVPEEF